MANDRTFPLNTTSVLLKKDLGTDQTGSGKDLHEKADVIQTTTTDILQDTADIQPKIGNPATGTVSGDIAAIKTDTDSIKTTVENTNTEVNDSTHGLTALKSQHDTINGKLDTLDNKADSIQTDVTTIKTNLGTPSTGSVADHVENIESLIGSPTNATISADLVSLDAKVSQIQNNTRTTIAMSADMELPDTGNRYYKITLNNYDTSGNMEEPDSAPTVTAVNTDSGADLSANLGEWDGTTFTAGTTMVKDSDGRYHIFYKVASTDDLIQILMTFTIVEGTVTRYVDRSARIVDDVHSYFTATDRSTLVDTNTKVTDIQSKIGTPSNGTLSADHDALHSQNNTINTKIDTVQSGITDIKDTQLPEIKTKSGGTYDRDTMSLEAISENFATISTESRLSLFKASKQSGSIASGGDETVILDETAGVASSKFLIKELRVIPTTNCSDYTIELFEDATGNDLLVKIEHWNSVVDGDLRLALDAAFFSSDSTKNAYVKITNNDTTAIVFDVELRAVVAY